MKFSEAHEIADWCELDDGVTEHGFFFGRTGEYIIRPDFSGELYSFNYQKICDMECDANGVFNIEDNKGFLHTIRFIQTSIIGEDVSTRIEEE